MSLPSTPRASLAPSPPPALPPSPTSLELHASSGMQAASPGALTPPTPTPILLPPVISPTASHESLSADAEVLADAIIDAIEQSHEEDAPLSESDAFPTKLVAAIVAGAIVAAVELSL